MFYKEHFMPLKYLLRGERSRSESIIKDKLRKRGIRMNEFRRDYLAKIDILQNGELRITYNY